MHLEPVLRQVGFLVLETVAYGRSVEHCSLVAMLEAMSVAMSMVRLVATLVAMMVMVQKFLIELEFVTIMLALGLMIANVLF